MKRVYYYSDELNDDFAGTNIRRKPLPADYDYFPENPVRKFFGFLLYRVLVTPVVFLFEKIVYREKIINGKLLRKYGKDGCFLYANHTSAVGDAFTPTLVAFPKKAYILVNPDAVSVPVAGKIVPLLGGVPLPTDRHGMRNFRGAVLRHAEKKHCVMIYPEAHIWPYYTGIRPFKDVSFRYPAETGKPVFCYTTTFQKRKFFRLPKVTVYVDGPFYPDKELSVRENQKQLRNAVYETMKERSRLSTYEYVSYVKVAPECRLHRPAGQPRPVSAPPSLSAPEIALSETLAGPETEEQVPEGAV